MSTSYKGNKCTETSALVLKFQQPRNPLESLLEHGFRGRKRATPRISDSVGQGQGTRICISKSLAPTAGPRPYFENHWVKGKNYYSSEGKKIYMTCDKFYILQLSITWKSKNQNSQMYNKMMLKTRKPQPFIPRGAF